jgi:hypothetical protein
MSEALMSNGARIDAWLSRLDNALRQLPADRRGDIVTEARGHLMDRLAAGLMPDQALHGFGEPETYARPFADDFQLNTALEAKKTLPLVLALLTHARRGLTAVLGLFGAAFFVVLFVVAALELVLKILLPEHVGAFQSGNRICYLYCGRHPPGREIWGIWFYLINGGLAIFAAYMAQLCLRLASIALVRRRAENQDA